MSDLLQLKTALRAWAVAAVAGSDAAVSFMDDPQEFTLRLPWRVELDGPLKIGGDGGWDVVRYTDAADDMLDVTVIALRRASIMVRVVSRETPGNAQAEMLLERLRIALKKPSTLGILQAAGIAVIGAGPGARYRQVVDGRNEAVAAFDLRFSFEFTDTSNADTASDTIGSIGLTSHVSNADGVELPSPPNLTDVVIGETP